jgi:DNA helicase II / ATP-dependent DNA helicase PcrA
MSSKFLNHLNPSQQKAASHTEGPLLVVAGAGSGKTRTLTYRIVNLLLNHDVEPDEIMAVTFTNKAAKEMSARIFNLLAQEFAQAEYGTLFTELSEFEQKKLRSRIHHRFTKTYAKVGEPDGLWIGTFHSLCARILRHDIDKFTSEKGYKWQKNFSIFDESDAQSLVKDIVTKQLNLDDKKFDPKSVRYAISNAKNRGWSPAQLEKEEPGFRSRTIAQVYERYRSQLAANNALDFDDLIYMPVQLFQQNAEVLNYWHQRFKHVLVDEYQDTNRTQYDLIRLLVTNDKPVTEWNQRSVFVVGDADQSIYSFRLADFTILMEFQDTFGDRLPDQLTQTMIKLEENYRSVANILEVANHLIANNSQRIDKVLRPTRPDGDLIHLYKARDEIEESQYAIEQIRKVLTQTPGSHLGHFAILYRTNAQSRAFEEMLVRWNILYKIVGGLRFYDRKEIKDILGYLRLLANPADSVSLLRVINTPRRGIGAATIDRLIQAAQELQVPIWELLSDETSVKTLAARSAKAVLSFTELISKWLGKVGELPAPEIIKGILNESGYVAELQAQGTDEAEDRIANLNELYNAALQFVEENEDTSLNAFLANAALASSLDDTPDDSEKVTLMTLHASKGLEFPVVFLVGLEQGLFPSFRSLDDPMSLEEERRLLYVGITRAQEKLFISHASERRLYGNRESASPSQFLSELPKKFLTGNVSKLPTYKRIGEVNTTESLSKKSAKPSSKPVKQEDWQVGDRIMHTSFGEGKISNLLGTGDKMFLAISFAGIGKKIIDPKLAPIQKLDP